MNHLSLKNVTKDFGETKVVKGISLDIQEKEFVVLVGPSGCGKSTMLRMIAGLESLSSGNLEIKNQNANDWAPKDRSLSFVFQDYALYPHMNVYDNMAFGPRAQGVKEDVLKERITKSADLLNLTEYLKRKPRELSGGQRQRVAMGRALVKQAEMILFDEPLSNLDAKLRSVMRAEIKKLHKKNQTTTIYVTHDQVEAMTLADRLVVMNEGKIEQVGTPLDVYKHPKSKFVAKFIGSPPMNFFEIKIEKKADKVMAIEENGLFELPLPESKAEVVEVGQSLSMGIRPSDILLSDEEDGDWNVEGTVSFVELLGKNAHLNIKMGNTEVTSEVAGHNFPEEGEKHAFRLNLHHVQFFDPKTSENILFTSL
jgi:multiple sugar transport system ATP-binding protein